jgi:olefin beta-lactone synthetase
VSDAAPSYAENIASTLTETAKMRPHALAVACPAGRDSGWRITYTFLTFEQLDRQSDELADGLDFVGIGPGVRTALMVKPSLEFFLLTFALFKAGAVPILIDPGMGIKNLGKCLEESAPAAFIGVRRAIIARRLFGWAKKTLRITVDVNDGSKWAIVDGPPSRLPEKGCRKLGLNDLAYAACERSKHWEWKDDPFQHVPAHADDLAAILFTSGSTGPPKGAEYTHGMFTSQVKLLRDVYGIEPGEIDLCTFPLFALFAPALGMTSIIPRMDPTRPAKVKPNNILNPIHEFGVTNLFGSPALIRRVGEFGASQGVKLPTLRRVISAGAPVPARVLEQFAKMLAPGVQIFTPYGATESLPVASIGSDEILGETRAATDQGAGVCVGRPVEGMSVEVIQIRDEPIAAWSDDLRVPEGTTGEFVVRGPVVSRAYFERPDATRLAKITAPDGVILHRMGDVGARDAQGRLWFRGRKSHRVTTAEGTLFTIPVEAVFNVHPDVNRTALVGIGSAGRQRPVLCVEPKHRLTRSDRTRILAELRAIALANEHTKMIETFLFHKSFPVDIRHNAKIFREKLAVWAEGKL